MTVRIIVINDVMIVCSDWDPRNKQTTEIVLALKLICQRVQAQSVMTNKSVLPPKLAFDQTNGLLLNYCLLLFDKNPDDWW